MRAEPVIGVITTHLEGSGRDYQPLARELGGNGRAPLGSVGSGFALLGCLEAARFPSGRDELAKGFRRGALGAGTAAFTQIFRHAFIVPLARKTAQFPRGMVSPVRIDLHTHSNRSDGTEDPAVVMSAAAAANLDVVGLTDHDTISGWNEAAEAVPSTGVALVRGAEISCAVGGITVHLLGYLFDPDDAALNEVFSNTRTSRDHRARTMVDRLGADYDITWHDVLDRKSTRLNSSHVAISYAVICSKLKKY